MLTSIRQRVGALLVVAVVPALLSGCRSDENPTGDGTTLVDWHHGDKTSMSDVTLGEDVGDGEAVKKTYVVQPKEGGLIDPSFGPIRIDLDYNHGPVKLDGSEKRDSVLAPRHIKLVLQQNAHWRVEASCQEAVSVPMGKIGPGGKMSIPPAFFESCEVRLKRGDYDTRVLTLELFGDGRIEHSMAFDQVDVEAR